MGASKGRFVDRKSRKEYMAKTALLLEVEPGSYKVSFVDLKVATSISIPQSQSSPLSFYSLCPPPTRSYYILLLYKNTAFTFILRRGFFSKKEPKMCDKFQFIMPITFAF